MKVIAICNLPDGIKLDHAWFTAEDGLYAQKVAVKPLPQKLDENDWHRMFSGEYAIREAKGYGYNVCLKEITGETE